MPVRFRAPSHLTVTLIGGLPQTAMDSFDNFQYDNASSYGGALSVVDDTSSIYTANTQDNTLDSIAPPSVDLSNLSISEYNGTNGHANPQQKLPPVMPNGVAYEDFDAVLDDLKDEGQVDLPPHACR